MARTWVLIVLTDTARSSAISPRLLSEESSVRTSRSRALSRTFGARWCTCRRAARHRTAKAPRFVPPFTWSTSRTHRPCPANANGRSRSNGSAEPRAICRLRRADGRFPSRSAAQASTSRASTSVVGDRGRNPPSSRGATVAPAARDRPFAACDHARMRVVSPVAGTPRAASRPAADAAAVDGTEEQRRTLLQQRAGGQHLGRGPPVAQFTVRLLQFPQPVGTAAEVEQSRSPGESQAEDDGRIPVDGGGAQPLLGAAQRVPGTRLHQAGVGQDGPRLGGRRRICPPVVLRGPDRRCRGRGGTGLVAGAPRGGAEQPQALDLEEAEVPGPGDL